MPDNFSSSPADGTHTFDDFHANSAVTDGLTGNLDWQITAIGSSAVPTFIVSPNGIMRLTADGAIGDGLAVHLTEDAVTLGAGDGVVIRARVRMVTTITGNQFRFGLDDSTTATDGAVGVFVSCNDGVLSFDVASANGDVTKAVSGISTLTSGTTLVLAQWYDIELRLSGTNENGGPETIQCYVDGEFGGEIGGVEGDPSLLGSTETMEYKFVMWSTTTAAQVFEIDYYEVYIPRASSVEAVTSYSISPVDGTLIFDDFASNESVATGLVGSLNWDITDITNASTLSYVASPNGILRLVTDDTSGDGAALTIATDKLVLTGTNQVFRCRVRYPVVRLETDTTDNVVAANNFRIGFSASVTATEPAEGIWIDSAAGLLSFDCANATTDKTKAVTGIPTLAGGTTMILDTWYDLELRMSETNAKGAPAVISCFVDGYPAGVITANVLDDVEEMEFSIVHWTSAGNERAFDIDYYEAWLPRN